MLDKYLSKPVQINLILLLDTSQTYFPLFYETFANCFYKSSLELHFTFKITYENSNAAE